MIFELEDGARCEVGADPPRVLLDDAELWLERGEHVSLVGAQRHRQDDADRGARRASARSTAGELRSGHNVKVGYLSQHAEELEGGGARTVLEAAVKRTGLTPNQARALLGRFLFSGEEAEKPLDGLSGGERRRLSLAILVQSGANVLILDEPTNHLDLESREALEDALQAFPGSLILVTHDRALLDAVGTRTIAVEDYALRSYVGGWAEYARVREERKAMGLLAVVEPPAAGRPTARRAPRSPRPRPGRRSPSPTARRRTACASRRASSAPSRRPRRRWRRSRTSSPTRKAWATKYESAKSTARHTAAKRAVEDAYEALEAFEAKV